MKAKELDASTVSAVILAAGRGSRLDGETQSRPKCLVEVGGRSLLEHQLNALISSGIKRIFVVAGYQCPQVYRVARSHAAVICNDAWATTNSLFSLRLTRNWVTGPVLVLNGDVLMHPDIVIRLLRSGGNSFGYDSSSGKQDEHMKVEMAGDVLRAMSKDLPIDRCHGENIGMLYFNEESTDLLYREAEVALENGDVSAWVATAVERVARATELRGVDVRDLPWVEIDFPEDLAYARREVWPNISRACGEGLMQVSDPWRHERPANHGTPTLDKILWETG